MIAIHNTVHYIYIRTVFCRVYWQKNSQNDRDRIAPLLLRKNLNAAKPPEQSKCLGGNNGCKDRKSTWY